MAINNAYLRQHFRQLTEQFLRPFDQLEQHQGSGAEDVQELRRNWDQLSAQLKELDEVSCTVLQTTWMTITQPVPQCAGCGSRKRPASPQHSE